MVIRPFYLSQNVPPLRDCTLRRFEGPWPIAGDCTRSRISVNSGAIYTDVSRTSAWNRSAGPMARRLTTNQEIAGSIPASINHPFARLHLHLLEAAWQCGNMYQVSNRPLVHIEYFRRTEIIVRHQIRSSCRYQRLRI
jgi:hypothetical protein